MAPFVSTCSEYSALPARSSELRYQSARRPGDEGFSHASKVNPEVRAIDSLAGISRLPSPPDDNRPFPNIPTANVAPRTSDARFPLPEKSPAVDPLPSV